jgi:eukaryotic-like serine/threonine-protein kinase
MDTEDEWVGRTLSGRFELRDLIGRGGMASVYRAWDSTLDRFVAIKIFAASQAHDDARRRTEVSLLARLNHPHLVTLHDAHLESEGSAEPGYLVMELLEGETLRARLDNGPLSPTEPALIASDLAEALVAVHALDVVHRDLKPANILMVPTGLPAPKFHAKLADFGIAQLLGSERVTTEGTVIGTAGYLSPEQASGAVPGAAADVYALGLVILECITGRQVYPGTVAEALRAQASHDPPLPDDLPAAWMSLLSQMTARDPSSRPEAREVATIARENATELDEWMADHRESDAPTEETAPMLEPTRVMPAVPVVLAEAIPAAPVPRHRGAGFAVLLSSIGAVIVAGALFAILFLHPTAVQTEPTTSPTPTAGTSERTAPPGTSRPEVPAKATVPSSSSTPAPGTSDAPNAPSTPQPSTAPSAAPSTQPPTPPPSSDPGATQPPTPVASDTPAP